MAPKKSVQKATPAATNVPPKAAVVEKSTPATNYAEIQNEEVETIDAIFKPDYENVVVENPWNNQKPDISFKVKIRPTEEPETFVTLTVRFTASYPMTPPLLHIEGIGQFHERTQQRIKNYLANRPEQLVGDRMMHIITDEIRDALDDAVQAKLQGTLPSLDDERWIAEQATTALAKEAEEAEARKIEAEKDEEDRVLKEMMAKEVHRRTLRKTSRGAVDTAGPTSADSNIVSFDKPSVLRTDSEKILFTEVAILSPIAKTKHQRTFLSKPITKSTDSLLLEVKRINFTKSREEVMRLENVLQTLQQLHHPGLLNIVAFRIDKLGATESELVLCTDHADRGTFADLLDLGSINISRAKQFTVELLEALAYLHSHSVAHGSVSIRNISLIASPTISPKLANFGLDGIMSTSDSLPSRWQPPEGKSTSQSIKEKSDVWSLGIVISQIFLGVQIISQYSSPQTMLQKPELSESFFDFMQKMFTVETRKRERAYDLSSVQFLIKQHPVEEDDQLKSPLAPAREYSRHSTSSYFFSPAKNHTRRESSAGLGEPLSRYAIDFTELGRLGKGGYGAVVKARNKLDGGIYAVKKIKQAQHLLDRVISEVKVLKQLNHPFVVRYFSTWIEEEVSGAVIEDSNTETETATDTLTDDDGPRMDFGFQSGGGLDFVSSGGQPQIEFGDDSDDEQDGVKDADEAVDDDSEGDESSLNDGNETDVEKNVKRKTTRSSTDGSTGPPLQLRRSNSRKAASTLYIQMEYCERHTLKDLIIRRMSTDDSWRYVRQITEGLAHIHSNGIIHRDLKPDNIFIDVGGNPKIGDFGLATTAQYNIVEQALRQSGVSTGDMTRSVGTALYVAPELRTASNTTYNDKVDMYSLGIMFYEMCQPFATGMERINALQTVREKDHVLPAIFQAQGEKAAQGNFISCLISHTPSERLSSSELLRSDILPIQIEDEAVRQAIAGLSDPRSPHHQKMMSALFSYESADAERVKAMVWDAQAPDTVKDTRKLRMRGIARRTMESVFRRHGAEEARRPKIFPRSEHYANAKNVVQLLDRSGNLLQLPYDLTLPHARQLAKQTTKVKRTYVFGSVFRDTFSSGPPEDSEEVDFDIIGSGGEDDRQLNDAEVLKVMDEIVCEMPLFAANNTICFHLNDARILSSILEYCRIPAAQHTAVKEIISKLGIQQTWSNVRSDLRKFGLADTTLDDLHQFDFRDNPTKACSRLRSIFKAVDKRLRAKLETGIDYLQEVIRISVSFGTQRKIYISPLGSVNAKFYEDNFLFQCVLDRKPRRMVVAAGGRYDGLIKSLRPRDVRTVPQGAVGVSIGLAAIIDSMARADDPTSKKAFSKDQNSPEISAKRCDVLVLAVGSVAIVTAGQKLISSLWAGNVSAELATDRVTDFADYNLIVSVRHETSSAVRVATTKPEADGVEVAVTNLVSHLQQEIRDLESSKLQQPSLLRQASQAEVEKKTNVQVLMARHGGKKSNKYQIVVDAQKYWSAKLDAAKDGPILAVETQNEVLDLIQQTRLSDPESWRKAGQNVSVGDRQYVQQIQEVLASWQRKWAEGDGEREACVFNFRSQHCIYYDLGV